MSFAEENAGGKIIVIAGFNGLTPARIWARNLIRHSRREAETYSWRHADLAARAVARSARVTLIGHSLGGGLAQVIAERLPAGSIDTLITVAPFAPRTVDPAKVKDKVGYWLNILSARRWHDPLLNLAGRCFLGWRDQGAVASACENYLTRVPHQDFYKMMSERCGAVEHGKYRAAVRP